MLTWNDNNYNFAYINVFILIDIKKLIEESKFTYKMALCLAVEGP